MKKRLLHRLLSVCNSPFLYFSSLSSSSYCITGALQGFLQPSYRWQAASSAHLLLRPSLLLLLPLLRRQLFCFRLWQVPWWRLSILLSWLSAASSDHRDLQSAQQPQIRFFLFGGLFCNDGCIINVGIYNTGLILASLGSCHNNFLPYSEII